MSSALRSPYMPKLSNLKKGGVVEMYQQHTISTVVIRSKLPSPLKKTTAKKIKAKDQTEKIRAQSRKKISATPSAKSSSAKGVAAKKSESKKKPTASLIEPKAKNAKKASLNKSNDQKAKKKVSTVASKPRVKFSSPEKLKKKENEQNNKRPKVTKPILKKSAIKNGEKVKKPTLDDKNKIYGQNQRKKSNVNSKTALTKPKSSHSSPKKLKTSSGQNNKLKKPKNPAVNENNNKKPQKLNAPIKSVSKKTNSGHSSSTKSIVDEKNELQNLKNPIMNVRNDKKPPILDETNTTDDQNASLSNFSESYSSYYSAQMEECYCCCSTQVNMMNSTCFTQFSDHLQNRNAELLESYDADDDIDDDDNMDDDDDDINDLDDMDVHDDMDDHNCDSDDEFIDGLFI